MPNINDVLIRNWPKPDGKKQVILRDDALPGFGVRPTRTSASFVVEKRIGRNVRRVTVGSCSMIDADAARQQAAKILGEIAAGHDPRPPKIPTVSEVLELYIASKRLRPRSILNYRKTFVAHLADVAHLLLSRWEGATFRRKMSGSLVILVNIGQKSAEPC